MFLKTNVLLLSPGGGQGPHGRSLGCASEVIQLSELESEGEQTVLFDKFCKIVYPSFNEYFNKIKCHCHHCLLYRCKVTFVVDTP